MNNLWTWNRQDDMLMIVAGFAVGATTLPSCLVVAKSFGRSKLIMKKDKLLIISWTIIGINLVLILFFVWMSWFPFKYPYIASWSILLRMLLYCDIPALLAAGYILLYKTLIKRLKKRIRNILTGAVMIVIVCLTPLSFRVMTLIPWASPFGSKTENIDNYLKFDRYVEESALLNIIPKEIPESAESVHYFYRYRDIVEEDYDIYLKVKLPRDEFEEEQARVAMKYPTVLVVEKENGTVDYQVSNSPVYQIISFSESDLTVTYTEYYALEGYEGGLVPYFEEVKKAKKI